MAVLAVRRDVPMYNEVLDKPQIYTIIVYICGINSLYDVYIHDVYSCASFDPERHVRVLPQQVTIICTSMF